MTTVYDIYAIDKHGNVSAEAHPEIGPQIAGIIIRLSPVEVRSGRAPRPVLGRSDSRYWQNYFTTYSRFGTSIRLDLKYSQRTDRKMMQEVLTGREERFGQQGQFDFRMPGRWGVTQ